MAKYGNNEGRLYRAMPISAISIGRLTEPPECEFPIFEWAISFMGIII
jgi:hypothetical protein